MFFILSKTISVVLMPIFWVLAALGLALYTRSQKLRLRALRLAFALLLIFTNPALINSLLLWWEVPPTPLAQLPHTYDVGIVLTGITRYQKSPKDRVYLDAGADRLMHALWLYREGKIKKILITGGIVDIYGNTHTSEARSLAEVLRLAQVPAQDIILEENARNTRENALLSKPLLDKHAPKGRYLLITSAFHLPRARACFQRVGITTTDFAAGFYTFDLVHTGWGHWVPSEKSLGLWYILIHEMLGYAVYKLVGYA